MRRQCFVRDHERDHDITKLCRMMEISRAGYYDWRTRPPSVREQANVDLLATITDIHARSRRPTALRESTVS